MSRFDQKTSNQKPFNVPPAFGYAPAYLIDTASTDKQYTDTDQSTQMPGDWQERPEANQEHFDRRKLHRKKPPKTSFRVRVQRIFNHVAYKIYASRGYQIGFCFITLTSVALLWFTLTERISLIDENYSSIGRRGELESELLKTQQLWSHDKLDEISANIKNADQRRVFADYQSLATWLFEKGKLADSLSLTFSYLLGDGQPAKIDNTLEVPISISLNPNEGVSNAGFIQMMDFMRQVVSASWYVDIRSASIESDGKGVKALKLEISIWVHGQVNADE